ncbi:MAG TPA: hypothetical protein K8V88_08850 [Companilactobacillus farciminis]|uniref:Uncharacterized protein n=1 Tax=Companilactobacillus farciminis TaxID=1612 RepID=A0A921HSF2_9LACO|nr:hypothetical protein [Companilactobacillus farciminis]
MNKKVSLCFFIIITFAFGLMIGVFSNYGYLFENVNLEVGQRYQSQLSRLKHVTQSRNLEFTHLKQKHDDLSTQQTKLKDDIQDVANRSKQESKNDDTIQRAINIILNVAMIFAALMFTFILFMICFRVIL